MCRPIRSRAKLNIRMVPGFYVNLRAKALYLLNSLGVSYSGDKCAVYENTRKYVGHLALSGARTF